jgi:hypothetical protein
MRHRGFEMGLGKFRRGRQRRLEIRQCLDRLVEAAKRMTAIGQDLRMTGHRRQRFVIARQRRNRPVQPQERIAPVDARADMAGGVRQDVIIARQRVVDAAKRQTGVAEIIENFRMIRRKLQRVAKACHGFVVTAGRMQRQTEIRQRIGGAGIDLERRCEKMKRLDHALALEVEHAKQVQRLEVFRPVLQDPGAQPLGLGEIAFLKRMMRLPLQARQVRHARRVVFPLRRQGPSFQATGQIESHRFRISRCRAG